MDEFLNSGFIDTYRHFYPTKEGAYTYWDTFTHARNRNVGWRIDYQIVSRTLAGTAKAASIYKEERYSDHAPLTLEYSW